MNYTIGIDVGTSATKTALFDEEGRLVASVSQEYPMAQPHNGWAEQDPADWADAAVATLCAVLEKSGVDRKAVRGIGLSGQMHGLVMLDGDNNILRPAILWCDQRTGEECDDLTRMVGRENLIRITANPATTGFTAAKILWVKKHEPQIFKRCRHILLPKDYVRLILTGEYATDVSDASGMQLLDVPNRCWSQELLQTLGIDPSLLAKVFESPDVTGTLTEEISRKTGLSQETVVVGGAGDNAAAAVGTGVVADGRAFTTIGTSGVVFAHTSTPVIDPLGRVHTFCCAVPGCWHVMGVTQGAGLSLKWFRDNFCQQEIADAKQQSVDPYVLMDKMAADVPPGSRRLLYLPYLMGERTPHLDPDCRGVFFGLSAIHGKADMIRAVMEGVSFSLGDCYDILSGMSVQPQSMFACGGGGSSPLWRQMLADVFGCPVQTCSSSEGGALGAAILAGVGAGMYESVPAACDRFIHAKKVTQPQPDVQNTYQEYHALYQQLYCDLSQEYKALAQLP